MNSKLSNDIKAEARHLGFVACGIAEAEPVEETYARRFAHWIETKQHASMAYMGNYADKRLNPLLLMDGLKSIVSVALSYSPAKTIRKDSYQFAAYALGKDYHDVMKAKLFQLASHFKFDNFRVFCDTGPVLERYWAVKSGMGWIGKHHQLIVPHAGSMVFIGELFLDIALEYDSPMKSRCGKCHACVDVCPLRAIGDDGDFDASKCLSYQTIENRGELSPKVVAAMGDFVYGCDRCQAVCPWNRAVEPNTTAEFQPNDELLSMTKEEFERMSEEDYRRLFKGSAVKRAKYSGLMRNIHAVMKTKE